MKFPMPRHGVVGDFSAVKPALSDCIEAVLLQSDALMGNVLDTLDAQVKSKSAYIGQSPANKLARQHLVKHGPEVKATFAAELRAALYLRGAHEMAMRPILRFDDFQFLEEDEIDANIEFALAQQQVLEGVSDTLAPLHALISTLLGLVTVQSQLNPLKPDAFVQALRATISSHVSDEAVRVALLTATAGMLGISLRQLYKDLTHWLISYGVEPALPAGAITVGGGLGGELIGPVGGARVPENSVSRTLLTLDKLRRLLSGQFDAGAGGSAGDFLHTVPASYVALEDLELMEPMLEKLYRRAKRPKVSAAKAALGVNLLNTTGPGKNLGLQLGGEVVRLMLENLMTDGRLLPRVRALIKQLEPVLLALSQSDPRFFSEREHPARQLLDRLTHRSLAYSSENDAGFGRFSKAISNSVQVLQAGDGDAASFARALRKLEDGWARDEDAQRKRQEEAARALLHAEQRNLLAKRFSEDLQRRVKDKDLPELVLTFLRGPWAQVIAQSQLSCADGVSDPDGYLALVDDLVWSVQPRLARRNRSKLVVLVPALLMRIKQGLQKVDYRDDRMQAHLEGLIASIDGEPDSVQTTDDSVSPSLSAPVSSDSAFPPTGAGSAEMPDAGAAASDQFWVVRQEVDESGYLAETADLGPDLPVDTGSGGVAEPSPWSAADLNIGSWVELMIQGAWVRAQLTWASPHLTLFMFVSGQGLAHSMSRRTMDRRRAQGKLRVVSDGNLVGGALDAVAQIALRNNLEQPEP